MNPHGYPAVYFQLEYQSILKKNKKINNLTYRIDANVFSTVSLVLEIVGCKMSVKRILSVLVVLEIPPGVIDIAGVVEPVIEESRSIGIAQCLVSLGATSSFGQPKDIIASFGITVHSECVGVIGSNDHQSLVDVDVGHCCGHGVVELGYFSQGKLSVILVVGQIDLAAFDLLIVFNVI